jgi:two-component system phosphate regulon sensor histidine kinase PhoR
LINSPQSELRRFALILALGLIVGIMFDAVTPAIMLVLVGYIAWYFRQLSRLYEWLNSTTPADPPASHGLWGAVFDEIHRLQQRQFKYRAKLKKVIKRFRDSTYALKDGFVMLDRDGVIDWWNPAASLLLGLRDPQDKNQLISNLIRDPDFKNYLVNKDFDKPISMASPINAELELEFHLALFGKKDLLLIVRDVTELQRLEMVRTDFVANVSHELRTPLTVLDGYLENLSDNTDIIHPRWHTALQQMLNQTRRMKAMIEDLLQLSRLETRANLQEHTEIDVGQMMQRICTDLQDVYKKRQQQVNIVIDSERHLLGQAEEIYSLVSNLLINASKYSPEATDITLKWTVLYDTGQLSVSDHGIGVTDVDVPRLTERFYRSEKGRSQDVGGTGLGLAIVKHILIDHDASLSIASKVGKGSTFTCKFPSSRLAGDVKVAAS